MGMDNCGNSKNIFKNYNSGSDEKNLKWETFEKNFRAKFLEFTTDNKFDTEKFRNFAEKNYGSFWKQIGRVFDSQGNKDNTIDIAEIEDFNKRVLKNKNFISNREDAEWIAAKHAKLLFDIIASSALFFSYKNEAISKGRKYDPEEPKHYVQNRLNDLLQTGLSEDAFCSAWKISQEWQEISPIK